MCVCVSVCLHGSAQEKVEELERKKAEAAANKEARAAELAEAKRKRDEEPHPSQALAHACGLQCHSGVHRQHIGWGMSITFVHSGIHRQHI